MRPVFPHALKLHYARHGPGYRVPVSAQLARLRQAYGPAAPEHIFIDLNQPGDTWDRPAYRALDAYVQAHPQPRPRFGIICVDSVLTFGTPRTEDGRPHAAGMAQEMERLAQLGWTVEVLLVPKLKGDATELAAIDEVDAYLKARGYGGPGGA